MSEQNDDIIEATQDAGEDNGPDNFFIDILTGNKESPSAKKLLGQEVLRQLIESYGFDRHIRAALCRAAPSCTLLRQAAAGRWGSRHRQQHRQ